MLNNPGYEQARDLLLNTVAPIGKETVPLTECFGRILAEDLIADKDVPAFDRTPYDGYAFRSEDTEGAALNTPVTLRVLEEIPAGGISHVPVTPGTAVRVMTGAPIPEGANAVINYEVTKFTDSEVTLFGHVPLGKNIVTRGEDVKQGSLLAESGRPIDSGTVGTLAGQGAVMPKVYCKLRVGVLSTGSELVEPWEEPGEGMIRNANAYTVMAILRQNGFEPVYLGIAGDSAEKIAAVIEKGLSECDAIVSTGGVSAGDYDLTPAAMLLCGMDILIQGARLKPGMACRYGKRGDKLMCALSGNPVSSIANLVTIALPALRKMAGYREPIPEMMDIIVKNGFPKGSNATRVLWGRLVTEHGKLKIEIPTGQGNVILSSTVGCNAVVLVPGGSGPLEPGTILKGFLV